MSIRRSVFACKRYKILLSCAAFVACSPNATGPAETTESSGLANPAATAVASIPVQNTLGAELAGPARRPVDAKLLAKVRALSDKLRDAELPAGQTLRTHGYTLSEEGEISGEFQPILSDHDRTHGHGTSNDPTSF